MNKHVKRVAALLFSMTLLLSVFKNTGFFVRAQAIEYLSDTNPSYVLSDTGNSDYMAIGGSNTVKGISGAVYSNGVRVLLTRDSDDGISFMAMTYEVKNNASDFTAYVDLDDESENNGNFSVRFEVFAGETAVFTQILTPTTQYPVKVKASVSGAEKITVRFGDTAMSEGETAFIIGNAALCESGSSTPSVTVPEQSEDENEDEEEENEDSGSESGNNSGTVTDLSADVQELLNRSEKYLGHNYLLVTMQITWEQAATWCEMQGGYLATVGSEAENRFIADYLRRQGNRTAYLGMSNSGEDGDFQWQNGETALYFNWARQAASINGNVYVQMGGGSDEWTIGKANEQYLSFVIEWGEKEVLSEEADAAPDSAIIIIAGLGGSNLSDSDTNRVWARKSENHYELSLDNVAVGKDSVTAAGSEYGAGDTYRPMMEKVSQVFSDSDVVLFEWDWRGSAEDAVDGLEAFIENGQWSEVSLIGHNTGGLVACYFIGKNGTDNVAKIITLGTPFYGTEKAYCMMETGIFSQGVNAARGSAEDGVSELEALWSLVPEEPKAGSLSFTGKMTEMMPRDEVMELAGAEDTAPVSESLDDVYELIRSGEYGGAYIVAGTGEPTAEAVVVIGGEITEIINSFDGDGLTGTESAAMNFESARPPYIIDDTDAVGLVTDDDSIALVCNILSGAADTSAFADGMSKTVYRSAHSAEGKPARISFSGSARVTVVENGQSVILSAGGYSFSGSSQNAVIYNNGVKSVFTSDESAQITVEILGSGVCFEISDESGTRTWTDIPMKSGSVLKTTVYSDVLTVTTDTGNSGRSEIEADSIPVPVRVEKEETVEEIVEEEKPILTWNVWAAIGLLVAAAAVALILMPYFAYRVSKVETDRKKRAIKQSMRQKRQQMQQLQKQLLQQQQTAAQQSTDITAGAPALPAAQDGSFIFDINEGYDSNDAIDYSDYNSGQ